MSVNVSGLELVRTGYTTRVLAVLKETGWPAGQLVLEVTESVLDADTPLAIDALHCLRAEGIRIAIDDFGNGYSSLSRIHLLPADIIKLDASFTVAITPDGKEAPPLLQAVAALGTALGLPVLAEGVETAHQAAIFARIGFELAQGFYFARGLPLVELKETLAAAAILPSAGSSGLFP
nr:EAL domain-containing protein [Mycolicibacterium hodleri]